MSWLRVSIIGILAIVFGVLSNLLAAVIQGTVGQFTLLQAVAMFAGATATFTVGFFAERWPSKTKLFKKIEYHREQLQELDKLGKSGQSWTFRHESAWRGHQDAIEQIKRELQNRDVNVPFDPLDLAPSPAAKTGCPLGCLSQAKRIVTLLAFPVALVIAFYLSPVTHHCYLYYVATPTPILLPTKTVTATVTIPPTRPVVPLPTTTPSITSPIATPTHTPSHTPTLTPTYTPTFTPTPTDMPTPIFTPSFTSTKWLTFTPTPVFYPPPALIGAEVLGCNVTFKWAWARALAEDEWFDVRVNIGMPNSVTWVKEYEFTHSLKDGGEYSWEIAICKGRPEQGRCSKEGGEELATSERRTFYFTGCSLP